MPEEWSHLQTIAVICVKLDQGEPEERIRECLDIEDELFAFCVEFAIENNLIIKQKDGSMRLQSMGKSSNGRVETYIYRFLSFNMHFKPNAPRTTTMSAWDNCSSWS